MKKLLIAVALLPFAAGIACASETLTNQQMDQVTAGGAIAFASAHAFAIGGIAIAATDSFAGSFGPVSFSASHSFSGAFSFF
jgi:hypothetical protein